MATDLHRAGGIPRVMKILLANGLLHGSARTITGETVEETLRDVPAAADGDVIRPFDAPLYRRGSLRMASFRSAWRANK